MRLALFLGLLFFATVFALWKGKSPERLAALIMVAGIACSMLFRAPYETSFGSINLGVWLSDAVIFIGLMAIAIHAERFWTIWIASFQLVQLVSHLPELLIPHLLPTVHTTILSL